MKPTYDPSKKYTWTAEDTFEMTGQQFGLILNTLRSIVSTPDAQIILLAAEANKGIEEIMANAVNKGVAKEQEAPQAKMQIAKDEPVEVN